MVLCFMVSSVVHAWDFVYDLSAVGSSYHLHWSFALLQLVNSAVYFRATCNSV
jgi:hypothetical protein